MSFIRKTVFLLAASTMLLSGGGVVAQTVLDGGFVLPPASQSKTLKASRVEAASDTMRLGYCVDELRLPGLMMQDDGNAHAFGGAIQLDPAILNKYVGDKIEAVEFAISPVRGISCQVFVTTDLSDLQSGGFGGSSSVLSSVTLTSGEYHDGWNNVKLKKAVTITKDMTLYVGYSIQCMAAPYDFVLFDQSTYAVSGKNWYGSDNSWFNNTAGIDRNICVRAIVTGDNKPQNDISLMSLVPADGSNYSTQNLPKDYVAYVQNNGTQPINSFSITVEAKGQRTAEFLTEGVEIPNNKPVRVDLKDISLPFEGNYDGVFTVAEVNGDVDPDMTDNTKTISGCYSIKQGAVPETHRVLFEEFTSEGYDGCYMSDTLYRNVIEDLGDIIWVKHHSDYQKTVDQFKFGNEADYEALYGGSPAFVPAVCFDRRRITGFDEPGPAYFSPYHEVTDLILQEVREILAFIDLDVKPTIKEDGKLEAKIQGYAGVNEMPLQNSLRLTTWLVEDSIPTTTQKGRKDFIQNGVLRAVLSENGVWGDPVDISSYEFERSYTAELAPSWNRKHLRVVSFVSNWDEQNIRNRSIYNTNEAPVKDLTAIVDASTDQLLPSVQVVGSSLAVTNGRIAGVYDVSGRQMDASQLPKGIYVVKLTNGAVTTTQKVYVK